MASKTTKEFTWITSEHPEQHAFIAVDKQLRLYFNIAARDLFKNIREVFVGYDFANRRLVIANPEINRPAGVKPHRIDKRGYSSARPFLRTLGLRSEDLPLKYEYIGKDHTMKGAYVFGMYGEPGEDGKL